jgi:hypothetical protein
MERRAADMGGETPPPPTARSALLAVFSARGDAFSLLPFSWRRKELSAAALQDRAP